MQKTIYQQAKQELNLTAKQAKDRYPLDKPAQRMVINDNCYFIGSNYNLSEYQKRCLENYAAKLQPK